MKKTFLIFSCVFFLVLAGFMRLYAEDASVSDSGEQDIGEARQEITAEDKGRLMKEFLEFVQEGRLQEERLKEQIKAAEGSGDSELVNQLKEELKLMHKENAQNALEKKKELGLDSGENFKEALILSKPPELDFDKNPPGGPNGPVAKFKRKHKVEN